MNKKFITAAALAATMSVQAGNGDKVKIVHNGKVIEVSANAVSAHLAHGDELYVEAPAPTSAPPAPAPTDAPAPPTDPYGTPPAPAPTDAPAAPPTDPYSPPTSPY